MGAYNWLRTVLECYSCRHQFAVALQVHIGWCRYDEYALGDAITWMTAEERAHAAEPNRAMGELRTMVEVGSPEWRDFATSAGDEECPRCHAHGTALVIVNDNVFQRVVLIAKQLAYGDVVNGDRVNGLLTVNDHTTRILRRALQLLGDYREGRGDLRSLVNELEAGVDALEERLPDEFYARWHEHWDQLEIEVALRALEADQAQAIGLTRSVEERQAAVIAELRALETLLLECAGGA